MHRNASRRFGAAELCILLYGMAKVGKADGRLLAAVEARSGAELFRCGPDDLYRAVWGMAAAGHRPGRAWLDAFCRRARARSARPLPAFPLLARCARRLGASSQSTTLSSPQHLTA
jgi:ferredoxin-NADP reductase